MVRLYSGATRAELDAEALIRAAADAAEAAARAAAVAAEAAVRAAAVTAVETEVQALRDLWVPVTLADDHIEGVGHVGGLINAANEDAWIEMYVPDSFTSLAHLSLHYIARSTGSAAADITVNYCAYGEVGTQHTQTSAAHNFGAVTANYFAYIWLDALVGNLAAGDELCIKVTYNTEYLHILGARLTYT